MLKFVVVVYFFHVFLQLRADPFSILPLNLDKRFLEITADIFYLIGLDGKLKSWNHSLERFCGLLPDKMKDRPCFDFVCEQDRSIVAADVQAVFSSGSAANIYRFIRSDGALIPFHCNGIVVYNDHGDPIGFAGLGRDISELQEKEQQLHDAREAAESASRTIRKIASQVPGVVFQFRLRPDGSSCFPFASEAMREIFRIGPEEVREDASQVFARIHPDDYKDVLASIQESARALSLWHHETRVKFDDGTVRWLLGNAIPQREADGSVLWHGFVTDITARKEAEEQIKTLAFYDTLTQLPNRRMLNDRIRQAIAASKRNGCYCALMFMDLDNFKPLNDAQGHSAGDALLIEAARRICSCVREVDTVARFGGDEFVVLLSELGEDKAESTAQTGIIAEKIRAALAEPYLLKLQREGKAETTIEHHCTASIGVVLFIKDVAGTEDIIKSADLAMYQAKNDGRNLIRFFDLKS